MKKRQTIAIILGLCLACTYILPMTSWGRNSLLSVAQGALESSGYRLEFAGSHGNPWHRLGLHDLSISGPGLALASDSLELNYNPLALLTGRFPAHIVVGDITGSISTGELTSGSNTGRSPIQFQLRSLSIGALDIAVNDLPYTLPNFSLADFESSMDASGIQFATTLNTSEGNLGTQGHISLNPFELVANVSDADVRIARHWWDGLEGGQASGVVRWQNGLFSADASITEGELIFLGERVTGIQGPVNYSYPKVTGQLQAEVLGGNAKADVSVDVTMPQWSGTLSGDLDLREAALWLARGRLPLDLTGWPISGAVTTSVQAQGWREVFVEGTAQGAGQLSIWPVKGLEASYSFETGVGTRVNSQVQIADGTVFANLIPEPGGFDFELTSSPLVFFPQTETFADVLLISRNRVLSGTTLFTSSATLPDRDIFARLSGTVQEGSWDSLLTGEDTLGAQIQGETQLLAGRLRGNALISPLKAPASDGQLSLELAVDGPVAALPIRASLSSDEALEFRLGEFSLTTEMAGELSALLKRTLVTDIQAQVGPLAFSGDLNIANLEGALDFALGQSRLAGPLALDLSLTAGKLERQNGRLQTSATFQTSAQAGPVDLEDLRGTIQLAFDDGWTLELLSDRLQLSLQEGQLSTLLEDQAFSIAGRPLNLRGTAFWDLEQAANSDIDLVAELNELLLQASGKPETLVLALDSPYGRITGNANVLTQQLSFQGQLDSLTIDGRGQLGAGVIDASINLNEAGDSLQLAVTGLQQEPSLRLQGKLPLATLARQFNLPVSGQLQADLTLENGIYAGQAGFAGALANIPVDLVARGLETRLALTGNVIVWQEVLAVSGTVWPEPQLTAEHPWGRLRLVQSQDSWQLTGAGILPAQSWQDWQVNQLDWQLEGDWLSQQVTAQFGQSSLSASLRDSGWVAEGHVLVEAQRNNETWQLSSQLNASRQAPIPVLDGVLNGPEADALVRFQGPLDNLAIAAILAADQLATLANQRLPLAGKVELNAAVNLLELSYQGTGNWQTPRHSLPFQVAGQASDWQLSVFSEQLTASVTAERATLQASDFQPAVFLQTTDPDLLTISGELDWQLGQGFIADFSGEASYPSLSTFSLRSEAEQLIFRLENETYGVVAQAQGLLFPQISLAVTAEIGALAQLNAQVQGRLSAAELSGVLETKALAIGGPVSLELTAQSYDLQANLATDWWLRLGNELSAVSVATTGLSGDLSIPILVQQMPHSINSSLRGSLSAPEFQGTVTGALVSGNFEASLQQLSALIQLEPNPLLSNLDLPLSLEAETLIAELHLQSDLSWQATLNNSNQLLGLPLDLTARLQGQGTSFAGTGNLNLAGNPVTVVLNADNGQLSGSVQFSNFQLESLASALPITAQGQLDGSIAFDSSQSKAISATLQSRGSINSVPFLLSLDYAEELSISGTILNAPISLEQTTDRYLLNLEQSDSLPLRLNATLSQDDGWSLEGFGDLMNEALVLSVAYQPEQQEALAELHIGSAMLKVAMQHRNDGWHAQVELQDASSQFSPIPLAGLLSASWAGGDLFVEQLELHSSLNNLPISLSLRGQALPQTQLSGLLELPGLAVESIRLDLRRPTEAWQLTASYQDLNIVADLDTASGLPTAALFSTVSLQGSASHQVAGLSLELHADSRWQYPDGFSGRSHLTVNGLVQGTITALGQEDLQLGGTLTQDNWLQVALSLTLAAQPWQQDIRGQVFLNATQALPFMGDSIQASAELTASGPLSRVVLAGPIHLAGPVKASGTVMAEGTTVSVQVSGDGLNAQAHLNPATWSGNITTDDFELSPLIAQVSSLSLSSHFQLEQEWGSALHLRSDRLELRAENSRLSGNLRYNGGLQGQLDTHLDLRDLQLDLPLEGIISGSLTLSNSRTISGNLTAEALRWNNMDASLAGTVNIFGPVAAPDITLQLNGADGASGTLSALLQPSRNVYSLASTLELLGFESNLSATLQGELIQARGKLSYGRYYLSISTVDDRILFNGDDGLRGWQLQVKPGSSELELIGNLSVLNPLLGGQLQLASQWTNSTAKVTGTLRETQLATLTLGDLSFSNLADPTLLVVSGPQLNGTLELSNSFAWQINLQDTALSDLEWLRASGEGNLQGGSLAAELRSRRFGENELIPLHIQYHGREVQLRSASQFAGGQAKVDISYGAAGISGTAELDQLSFGDLVISLAGQLEGSLNNPQLQASLDVHHPAAQLSSTISGRWQDSHLVASLSSPWLTERLELQGRVWPQPNLLLRSGEDVLNLSSLDDSLVADGRVSLMNDFLELTLAGSDTQATITATSKNLTGLGVYTSLPDVPLPKMWAQLQQDGLMIRGQGDLQGSALLRFESGLSLHSTDLEWLSPAGLLQVAGTAELSPAWADVQATLEPNERLRNWLPALGDSVPLKLELSNQSIYLQSEGPEYRLSGHWQSAESASLSLDLRQGGATATTRLSLDQVGLSGQLSSVGFPLELAGGRFQLDSHLTLEQNLVTGSGSLALPAGNLSFTSRYSLHDLLPGFLLSDNPDTEQRVNLRIDTVPLETLPTLQRYAPYLEATVSGIAQLSGRQVVGRIVSPELSIGGQALPLELDITGNLQALDLSGTLGRSQLSSVVSLRHAEGLLRFDRFPLEIIADARLGDTGVKSSLTGALRFDIPFQSLQNSDIRFSSEQFWLERDGIETSGKVSFSFQNERFELFEAGFRGAGAWEAQGVIAADQLSIQASALDADFSPLLGLIPQFATLDLGATGSLSISASGSLRNPQISISSPLMHVTIGNSQYRLEQTTARLSNEDLQLNSRIIGMNPITGELRLEGSGSIQLLPLNSSNVRLAFTGDAFVPILGAIEDYNGEIRRDSEGWQLDSQGQLGNPFRLAGSLNPLNLTVAGDNLDIRAPNWYLASSNTQANLNLRYDRMFILSGSLRASETRLSTNARTPQPRPESPSRNRLLERILFDNVRIEAPQQILIDEAIVTGELNLDLTLSGSAAQPELTGTAQSLRGNFRFSGRDFSVDQATASFQPSRGIYPALNISARTSFDKEAAKPSDRQNQIDFLEPRGGSSFDVILNLQGDITASLGTGQAFQINLTPELSSNAVIQQRGALGTQARSLNEDELYKLLTLGRLDATSITGTGSITQSVAQGALDTAVDLLILSELQRQLGEVLGVDLFEIRTTPLSSFLNGGNGESFGISFRIGGYLQDDLFASYQIGSLGLEQDVLLSNQFSLRYNLEPLELNLVGRVNILRDERFSPVPELGISLSYALSPLIRLQTGIEVANDRQSAQFGVSFRW